MLLTSHDYGSASRVAHPNKKVIARRYVGTFRVASRPALVENCPSAVSVDEAVSRPAPNVVI